MRSAKTLVFRSCVLGVVCLASCDGPEDEIQCSGAPTVTVANAPSETVNADLELRGTASHSGNLAIRQILVAGTPARSEGANFATWSVTVPVGALTALPATADGPDIVNVSIEAHSACGAPVVTSVPVRIDRRPGTRVDRLAVAIAYPTDRTYVPTSSVGVAVLTVTANPEAAGAVVTLKTDGRGRLGAGGETTTLTLAGDRIAEATGTVLFAGLQQGTALITATAKTQVATATVKVAGPPALAPSTATLKPGQKIRVDVSHAEGGVDSCQASASSLDGLRALAGGVDLAVMPGGATGFEVEADPALAKASEVVVTCRDKYGQVAIGTYRGEP